MRYEFDTTCDIYTGPGAIPALSLRGTFPCRLVRQRGIKDVPFGGAAPNIPYWMTIEGIIPKGMFVFPTYNIDTSKSDRVAIPSGTARRFAVIYTDQIDWKGQATYYRSYLLQLPFPDLFKGGVTLGGEATVIPGHNYHPIGGVLLGGEAHVVPGSTYHPIGGVLLGGEAHVVPGKAFNPAGGIVLGGSAIYNAGNHVEMNGSVFSAGTNAIAYLDPGTADIVVRCKVKVPATGGTNCGVCVRCTDGLHMVNYAYDSGAGAFSLLAWNGGVTALQQAFGVSLTPGVQYDFEITCSGTSITGQIIGVAGSALAGTSSVGLTVTKHGIMGYHDAGSYAGNGQWDDFLCTSHGTTVASDSFFGAGGSNLVGRVPDVGAGAWAAAGGAWWIK